MVRFLVVSALVVLLITGRLLIVSLVILALILNSK